MIVLLLILIIILNTIFQTTILPYFTIFGYLPNTALIFTVIIAILRGKYYGILFGLAIGIIQDTLFGTVIGVNALLYSMIGYSIGIVKNVLNTENIIVPTFFTVMATIAYNFLYAIVIYFLSREITLYAMIKNTFSIEIILNLLISMTIYKLLSKIFTVPRLKFGNR